MWVRSWPAPDIFSDVANHPHVVDDLYHLEIRDHDYATAESDLRRFADSDAFFSGLFLVEWDIVLDRDDYKEFEILTLTDPGRVHVAPYKLWTRSTKRSPQYAHWIIGTEFPNGWRPIHHNDVFCDMFSFGCIFIPWHCVFGFLDSRSKMSDPRMTDTNFAKWYRETNMFLPAKVVWSVRAVHLHW